MKERIINAENAVNALKRKDRQFYPNYHLAPAAGWMNDPNGLIYFNGQYHVFYQHHPFSELWGPMYWGHATSKDMVNWQHQSIALAPGEDYDKDGCFSGSAVAHEGKLYLFYTGHIWLAGSGDDSKIHQTQCLATSDDGINFTKHGVIIEAPKGFMHFRDPKVWREQNSWWMVVGARDEDDLGQVLLYKSDDLYHWHYEGILAKTDDKNVYMWECPDFFPLDNQHVILFSPQGKKPKGFDYRNFFQSGALVGQWEPSKPFILNKDFKEIDKGHDFYAPQTLIAADGRRILIAWMDMWESVMPSGQEGWSGQMTLPRELFIDSHGDIKMKPVSELISLRQNEIKIAAQSVNKSVNKLIDNAESMELELSFKLSECQAEKYGLRLGRGVEFFYDDQTQRLVLNRYYPEYNITGYRSAPLPEGDEIKLRIFIDRSSIEIFVNEDQISFSSRIYPAKNEREISFFAINGYAKLEQSKAWQLANSIEQ